MAKINLIMHCEEVYSLFSGEFSKSRFGGAGLQMYLLAEEFAKDPDIRVSFLFLRYNPSDLKHDSIRFITPAKMISRGVPGISRLINRKRKEAFLGGKPENTIFFSTMAGNAPIVRDFVRDYGTKSILRIASDADLIDPVSIFGEKKEEIFEALKFTDQVVVQTNKQKGDAIKNLNINTPVIKNGLPITVKSPTPFEKREFIFWVSNDGEIKQPHYFLDLAVAFPDEKFLMLMPSLNPKQSMRGAKFRVKHIPNLELVLEQKTFSEVNDLFRKAKLFINTSAREGFPNTFLQAAAAGVPILSFIVNPDNVLDEFGIGASLEGNFWSFPKKINGMLEDREVWQRVSDAGPKYIKSERNISDSAQQYKKLMLEVLARKEEL